MPGGATRSPSPAESSSRRPARILDADQVPGSTPVIVIGHELWQTRFGGDPDVVGQTVHLGSAQHTIVGVMPEGFGFPVAHEFWVPLQLDLWAYGPREGPAIDVFGRLSPGVTMERAQAELTALGAQTTADLPATHEHLRPELVPYGHSVFDMSALVSAGLYSINLFFVLFVFVVCANVALLVFARTAARESELVVRNALGASRGRIVMQLFAEALVLGGVAAVMGLVGASLGLDWVLDILETTTGGDDRVPFWFHRGISPRAVVYAAALTTLGALVAGALPALKATGRGIRMRLGQATPGGGLQFGGLWTGVIVTQVAFTVVFVPFAIELWKDTAEIRSADLGFDASSYLSARVALDRTPAARGSAATSPAPAASGSQPASASTPADTESAFLARYDATVDELTRRLEAEPGVGGRHACRRGSGGVSRAAPRRGRGYRRASSLGARTPRADRDGRGELLRRPRCDGGVRA